MSAHWSVRPAWHLVALITLTAFAGADVSACARGGGAEATDNVPAVVGARVEPVRTEPFTETIAAIGTVVPQAGHVAMLSAPVSTWVAKIYVNTGQAVQRGDSLIAFEPATFQANVASADAAYQAALQNRDRVQQLVTQGIDPRKDLDQADADLARAQADRVAARHAAGLAALVSPIDGVVLDMNTSLGATVDPSQPLVEVADPDHVDLMFSVSPDDATAIHRGDRVELHAGLAASGRALGDGHVVDIGGEVDSAARTVPVRVRPDRGGALRIGETAFGEIVTATHAHAVVVPLEALVPEGDGFKVFVVDSANVAHQRIVVVGGRVDSTAEITSGLEAGERIVTFGAYGVVDSARIVPPGGAAQPAARDTP
jgi:membrane fusion protein, heavy metal efflux system